MSHGDVIVTWARVEHTCFCDGTVHYTIEATYRPGARGNREEPDDPSEVEIVEVRRHDPVDHEAVLLDEDAWPFSPEELALIEERVDEIGSELFEADYGPEDYD